MSPLVFQLLLLRTFRRIGRRRTKVAAASAAAAAAPDDLLLPFPSCLSFLPHFFPTCGESSVCLHAYLSVCSHLFSFRCLVLTASRNVRMLWKTLVLKLIYNYYTPVFDVDT